MDIFQNNIQNWGKMDIGLQFETSSLSSFLYIGKITAIIILSGKIYSVNDNFKM